MPVILFAAPYYTENAKLFIRVTASQPGVALGLISQEPLEMLPPEIRALVRAHYRVEDALSADQLVVAARYLSAQLGPIHRMLAAIEQIQVPIAEARERLGVSGMRVAEVQNFRDKERMKDKLRDAGLPVARHRRVTSEEEAAQFADEVSYPVVVKPLAGAASQVTFRADDHAALREALRAGEREMLIEEMITGQEGSFDAFMRRGELAFWSVSRYHPTPLEVMQNPWIQWAVVLPREIETPEFHELRDAGARTLSVLGLETGMCHLEWFRRPDGRLIISEVAARPPGAQICTMIARAHDVDFVGAWARLMIFEEFDPFPPRRYAVGAAFLRGQGQGRVRAVHGLDVIEREVGHLVTDARLPQVGQEKARAYEGEGYIVVRHPETGVVEDALRRVVSTVRVELS
jgi:biotin carboxylase